MFGLTAHFDALGLESRLPEPHRQTFATARSVQSTPLQQQSAAGDAPQDARPGGNDLVIDFRDVAEAPESNRSPRRAPRRRRNLRSVVDRLKAKARMREAQDFLGKLTLASRRGMPRIHQRVVHVRRAGGGEIAEPGHLQRRRAGGEHGKPVVPGVSGQIDQRVGSIGADARPHLVVGLRRNIRPFREAAKLCGTRVIDVAGRIQRDTNALAMELTKHR